MTSSPDNSAQEIPVDAKGLKCPEPVMLLHAAVRKASSGEVIRLLATDPSTQRDVPQFCRFLNHELLAADADEEQGTFQYLIRKLG